jgi:hypothetical protein
MSNPGYQAAPPQPQTQKKKTHKTLIIFAILGALAVLCCGGVAIGGVFSSHQPLSATTISTPSKTTGEASKTPGIAATTAKAAPTTPKGPATTISDGDWRVGTQIASGTYETTVPGGGVGCYWARLSGFTGGLDSIIANDNVRPGAQVTVTISSTDKGFKSDGCGTWTKA